MGRDVRVSRSRPRAAAVCDRCGLWANHVDLVPQMEYQGLRLGRRGNLLVHRACRDVPNGTRRAQRLKPDGLPIRDPRPEPYVADTLKVLGTEAGVPLATETGPILIIDDQEP